MLFRSHRLHRIGDVLVSHGRGGGHDDPLDHGVLGLIKEGLFFDLFGDRDPVDGDRRGFTDLQRFRQHFEGQFQIAPEALQPDLQH